MSLPYLKACTGLSCLQIFHFMEKCSFIDLYGNQQKSLLVSDLDSQTKNHVVKLSSFAENALQLSHLINIATHQRS